VIDGTDGLLGMVVTLAKPDHLLLDTVAVAESARGGGYGRILLDRAELDAAEQGLTEVRLVTNELMTENLGYYPRRGYAETGRGTQDGYPPGLLQQGRRRRY
jgi:ribosomal protein S18 acetylase RimI-like enzyme